MFGYLIVFLQFYQLVVAASPLHENKQDALAMLFDKQLKARHKRSNAGIFEEVLWFGESGRAHDLERECLEEPSCSLNEVKEAFTYTYKQYNKAKKRDSNFVKKSNKRFKTFDLLFDNEDQGLGLQNMSKNNRTIQLHRYSEKFRHILINRCGSKNPENYHDYERFGDACEVTRTKFCKNLWNGAACICEEGYGQKGCSVRAMFVADDNSVKNESNLEKLTLENLINQIREQVDIEDYGQDYNDKGGYDYSEYPDYDAMAIDELEDHLNSQFSADLS